MKKTVGIGIIGTGFARKVQIPTFLQCEAAKIVSVASGRRENAERTAREIGVEHFTGDWRETVERADIDLICVTTARGDVCRRIKSAESSRRGARIK